MSSDQVDQQRRFYDELEHAHLRPLEDDFYSHKLAREVCAQLGIGPNDRVLEVGAGFGRFTFHLLDFCDSVHAVDLSQRALDVLAETRDRKEIPERRCSTRCADLTKLDPAELGEQFDFIVGFFLLHHLPDVPSAISRIAPLLAPGGGVVFLEPNRRNPLFLAQVACCQDMTWAEEKGMFQLSNASVERAYRDAALVEVETRRIGFFPPQILNRFAVARSLEERLEALAPLRPWLPFLLCSARAPGEDEPTP